MNLQSERANVIKQIEEVDDISLIQAIKKMLDFASQKEEENLEVPETHQKLVMTRFDKVRENPERLLDWEEARKTLKN